MTRLIVRAIALPFLLVLLLGFIWPELTSGAETDPATITVYITRTGKKYHVSGCRYLRQSKIKTNLAQAKADGYKPCKVCDPPE